MAASASRQRDALEYVKSNLREKNYAIVHRDDLFGEAEQELWDNAERFMHDFASSEEAKKFEQAFYDHVHANMELDSKEARDVARLTEVEERAKAHLAETKKAYEDAVEKGDKKAQTETKAAFKAASIDYKAAAGARYTTAKAFQVQRREQNQTFKPYVFNGSHWMGRSLKYDDPSILLSTASPLLDIANDYHEAQAKLRIPTIWRVSASPEGATLPRRQGSQLWHRDQTDGRILKLFIYYTDVDEGTGALEYIPDSRPTNSKWAEKIPLTENSGYPPQELVEREVPKDEIVKCSGRAGTLAFVDTAGLHRGGYATKGHRVTCQATYLHPNPIYPQNSLLKDGQDTSMLSPEQIYALS